MEHVEIPRVFCDFNDRIGPSTYGLRVLGVREDIERQGLQLKSGQPVVVYDYDGFDDGQPAWIIAGGTIADLPGVGDVVEVDPASFGWVLRQSDPQTDLRHLARFRAEDAFDIQGRGGVLRGSILQGNFVPGLTAAVSDSRGATVRLEIAAIEFVDDLARRSSAIGLRFVGSPSATHLMTLVAPESVLVFA